MTPKEIKQYNKDRAIKKYLLRHAKRAIGYDHKMSGKKFKCLKILLLYGKHFRMGSDKHVYFQTGMMFYAKSNLENLKLQKFDFIEYDARRDAFYIYFDDDFYRIINIEFISTIPVIIIR